MINNTLQTSVLVDLFLVSSILAIIIACLGLSGLSAYSITRRTKEIGIRKTNGSGIIQVLVLLNKDFVKWVVIAIIIASPIAWYALNNWLQNFAYKTISKLVDLCTCRIDCPSDCIINSKSSELESCKKESGGSIAI